MAAADTTGAEIAESDAYDELTGLLARRSIETRLADALRTGRDRTLVLLLSLDGFGKINDEHGHAVGDLVLVELARRLTRSVRPTDVVGRYGGDEFVIICDDVIGDDQSGGDGFRSAERATRARLRELLLEPIFWASGSWALKATIDAARPDATDDAASVLARADREMAAIKRSRRVHHS